MRYSIEEFENAVVCSWRNYLLKKHESIRSIRSLYFNCAKSAIIWYLNKGEFKHRPPVKKLLEKFKELWSVHSFAAPVLTEGYTRFRLLTEEFIKGEKDMQIGLSGLELIVPISGSSVEVVTTIGGAFQNKVGELKKAIVFVEEYVGKSKFLNSWQALFVKIGFTQLVRRPPSELFFQAYNLLRGWRTLIPMNKANDRLLEFIPKIAKRLEMEDYIPNPSWCNCSCCPLKSHCSYIYRRYR